MQKNLTIILVILLCSCGDDSSTNPISPSTDYHTDDNSFITELVNSNVIEMDSLNSRITTITTDGKDRIKTMDLSNLELEILPENIINLAYLEELDLSNNLFSDFPSELCEVSNQLSTLIIEKNLLCDPTSITHCVLEDITIDFEKQECTMVKYDEEMDFLLEFIRSNDLDSISSNIFNEVKWSWENTGSALTNDDKQIERIIEIKWINYGITNLPGTISHLNFLKKLQLENNKLTTLPTQMRNLEALENLQLHDNMLVALPDFIGDANNLTFIDLHNNMLRALPESIGLLTQLEYFDISGNELTSLPDTLCGLYSNGLDIYIECNDLEEGELVPECLNSQLGSQTGDLNCSGSGE